MRGCGRVEGMRSGKEELKERGWEWEREREREKKRRIGNQVASC